MSCSVKHFSRALLFVCLLFSTVSLFAVDWKTLKPQGFVSDFSGVVDAQSKAALEQYAYRVQQATGAQLAFVTVQTLEGEPIEDVANDLFHTWGIGTKGKDEGVLLLLVTGDRRSRLEIGHGLEPILPDGLDGKVLVEMRPALRAGQYGEAMLAAGQVLGSTIAQAKGVTIGTAVPVRRARRQPTVNSIPWPLILGALFLFFLLSRSGRGGRGGGGGGFLGGMILGNMLGGGLGRSYGSSSGGGFGGGDSSGGFGGFGGGDSGGGGASSDW